MAPLDIPVVEVGAVAIPGGDTARQDARSGSLKVCGGLRGRE